MNTTKKRLPEDILAGFFANFPRYQKFRYDRENFNRFFYKMKNKYPSLLECLVFRKREFPESGELDQAYMNLTYSGFLAYSFHDFLHESKKDLCKKVAKKYFSLLEMNQLKEMAKEYVRKFGVS